MRKLYWLLGLVGVASAEPTLVSIFGDSSVGGITAELWDKIYYIWLGISVLIYLVVAVPMLYFMIKYRSSKNKEPSGHTENLALEVTWTIIPLIIVIYLATQSFAFYKQQRTAPENSFEIKITAFMWGWEVDYPNGKKVYAFFSPEYNIPEEQKIVLPAGKPIKVLLTSRDVLHAFYVQPARVMEDAVPGRITHLWFQINKPGEYWAFCREYCGTQHARMVAVLKMVPQEEFDRWLNGGQQVSQLESLNKTN